MIVQIYSVFNMEDFVVDVKISSFFMAGNEGDMSSTKKVFSKIHHLVIDHPVIVFMYFSSFWWDFFHLRMKIKYLKMGQFMLAAKLLNDA